MKNLQVVFLSLLIFVVLKSSAQTTVGEVTMPDLMEVEGENLVLNGGGIRKKMFFKVYSCGLYLKEKSKDGNSIVRKNQAMAIKIHVTSSMVTSEKMTEAIWDGFKISLKGKTDAMKPKIDKFVGYFQKEAVEKGDVFDLIYSPEKGVLTYKNDAYQGSDEGLEFKQALFGIWLSDPPVDENLKEGMLGG